MLCGHATGGSLAPGNESSSSLQAFSDALTDSGAAVTRDDTEDEYVSYASAVRQESSHGPVLLSLALDLMPPAALRRVRAAARRAYLPPGTRADAIVFAAFNRLEKIDATAVEAWAGLLRRESRAMLWVLRSSEEGALSLRRAMQARGVPGHRVLLAPRVDKGEHLLRHLAADVFLDTRVYGAHTSASDALASGLPVVTVPGAGMASRVGAGLVRAAQHGWLAAPSHRSAVRLAGRLGAALASGGGAGASLLRGRLLGSTGMQCPGTAVGAVPEEGGSGGAGEFGEFGGAEVESAGPPPPLLFDPAGFAKTLGHKLRAARELAALECRSERSIRARAVI